MDFSPVSLIGAPQQSSLRGRRRGRKPGDKPHATPRRGSKKVWESCRFACKPAPASESPPGVWHAAGEPVLGEHAPMCCLNASHFLVLPSLSVWIIPKPNCSAYKDEMDEKPNPVRGRTSLRLPESPLLSRTHRESCVIQTQQAKVVLTQGDIPKGVVVQVTIDSTGDA